jgi:hypothetical protein
MSLRYYIRSIRSNGGWGAVVGACNMDERVQNFRCKNVIRINHFEYAPVSIDGSVILKLTSGIPSLLSNGCPSPLDE